MALSVREASERMLAEARARPVERVALRDALGRVLATDAHAPLAHPPWDNASMDGYAVRGEDVARATPAAPAVLRVLETVRAGQRPSRRVTAGTAVRIMTGAPVPEGADSVIRVEHTDGGSEQVAIRDAADAGRNVRPRGQDLAPGALAVASGTVLGPAHLGVLATIGAATVEVHGTPRVALLVSGDELVDVDRFDEVRRGDRIVSSNSYTLAAAVRATGAEPIELGIAGDDPTAYAERLAEAPIHDLLITSGGVSVGAFDFTREVLQRLGVVQRFWRVSMRPGAPLGFGTLGERAWLGLPGNPVSALVTFELFARPFIRWLRGEKAVYPGTIPVTLAEDVTITAPLTHFLRAVVAADASGFSARLTGPQGSGLLTSMARANALLVIPPDRPVARAGESVRAILLGDSALRSPALDV